MATAGAARAARFGAARTFAFAGAGRGRPRVGAIEAASAATIAIRATGALGIAIVGVAEIRLTGRTLRLAVRRTRRTIIVGAVIGSVSVSRALAFGTSRTRLALRTTFMTAPLVRSAAAIAGLVAGAALTTAAIATTAVALALRTLRTTGGLLGFAARRRKMKSASLIAA